MPPMHATGKQVLHGVDDPTFCDLFLHAISCGDGEEHQFDDLYAPWVLTRLRQIHQRAPHIFYGNFLGPLRRRYPRQVFVGDLFATMRLQQWEQEGQGGDVSPEEFLAAAIEYRRTGDTPGLSTGWPVLDEHYTVRRGELTIVTGVASHMKSTAMQVLGVNLCRDANWRIGLFSPEQAPVGQLGYRLVEQHTGLNVAEMPEEMFADAMRWVAEHFRPIVPPEETTPTLAWILGVARKQVRIYGIQGLCIDPWNEVDHQYAEGRSMTQYVSEALSRVRRFARENSTHVWIVAHPTKLKKAEVGPYKGKYPPPTPYDIADSAHFYNKADNCLSLWRDVWNDSSVVEMHIQKVRHRAVGKPGMVQLKYQHGRFYDA